MTSPSTAGVELLHAQGLKATPARLLILAALARLEHSTPEEVLAEVEPHLRGLSLSTVYRTLERLMDSGVVGHAHLAGPSISYMLTSDAPHAHLVCRNCRAVDEVDQQVLERFTASVLETHGFTVDLGHLSVAGVCGRCHDRTASGLRREAVVLDLDAATADGPSAPEAA